VAHEDRIELVIEGLSEDEGRVRVTAFMAQLQKFSATLQKIDKETNEGQTANIFEIVALSYSSPIRVTLEPRPVYSARVTSHLIVERLKHVAAALTTGSSLSGFDAELLEDIRGLAAPVGKSVKASTIVFNDTILDLTPRIAQHVEEALAVVDECEGFLEGHLDQINIHQGANTFHVYPEIGPKKVTCNFPNHLYDDAVSAVGRRVEVFGVLKYRLAAPFPHQIAVTGIDVIPVDRDLPDWEDIRGRAPDATGDVSSEAFIRELRNAW